MIKGIKPFIALLLCAVMFCGCTPGAKPPAVTGTVTNGKPEEGSDTDTSEYLYPDEKDGVSIVEANSFSDGAAWIVTKNGAGKYRASLINVNGKTLYTTGETDGEGGFIGTNFKEGVSLFKDVKGGVVSLINNKGEAVWSTDKEGFAEGERILGKGGVSSVDAYYYVNAREPEFKKIEKGAYFNGYTVICYNKERYGVIKPDGSWLMEPVKLDIYSFEFNSSEPYAAFRYDSQSNYFVLNFKSGELADLGRNGDGPTSIIYPQNSGVTLEWRTGNDPRYDKDKKAFVKPSGEVLIDLSGYAVTGSDQGVYDYSPEIKDGVCVLTVTDGDRAGIVAINGKGEELFKAEHPYQDESGLRAHLYAFSDGEGFIMYSGKDKEYYQFTGTEGAVYFKLDGSTKDFFKGYKTVYPFCDGHALVYDGEAYGYINNIGTKVFG